MAEIKLTATDARILAADEIGHPTPNVAEKGMVLCTLSDGSTVAMTKARFVALAPTAVLQTSGEYIIPFTLSSTTPADTATGVVVSADVVWVFDAPVDQASITTANLKLALVSDHIAIAGAFTYSNDDRTVTFNPTSNLTALTAHEMVASAAVLDLAGNPLTPVTRTFTTA